MQLSVKTSKHFKDIIPKKNTRISVLISIYDLSFSLNTQTEMSRKGVNLLKHVP